MKMKNLKALRNEKNISQINLARHMNVSRSTVSMWENGASEPDNETLVKLANFFGVTIDYLLGNEDKTEPQRVPVTEEDIMFALFGGEDVTPEMYEEVKRFAQFVKERNKNEQA